MAQMSVFKLLVVCVAVLESAPAWPQATYDLVYDGPDLNGFPLNPRFGKQEKDRAALLKDDPAAASTPPDYTRPGALPKIWGDCLDHAQAGNSATVWDDYNAFASAPDHCAHASWKDNPTAGKCPIDPSKGKPWEFTYHIGGHMNFAVATYDGVLRFDNAMAEDLGGDYDWNIDIYTPHGAGSTAAEGFIHTETNPSEAGYTFDKSPGFWRDYRDKVIGGMDRANGFYLGVGPTKANQQKTVGPMINGRRGLVVGILGLDMGHEDASSELHPVYVMGVHVNGRPLLAMQGPNGLESAATSDDEYKHPERDEHFDDILNPTDDVWAFYALNHGSEGYCSSRSSHLLSDPRGPDFPTTLRVRIPWARGMGAVEVLPTSRFVVTFSSECGQIQDGLCYPSCLSGFVGAGPVCWQQCKPEFADDGATCRKDAVVHAKPSKGRGVGNAPSGCGPGKELDAGLCYQKCEQGYRGIGPVCWGSCEPGYHDDGATCRRDVHIYAKGSYGRGVGTVMPCGGDEEGDAGLCYKRCREGYHGVGPVCWGTCTSGYHDDGGTCRRDTHIYGKPSHTRGVGVAPTVCPPGQELAAGLCYPQCQSGYHGVGPVCWGTCEADYHDDGATCRKDPTIYAKSSYGRGIGRVPPTNPASLLAAAGWSSDVRANDGIVINWVLPPPAAKAVTFGEVHLRWTPTLAAQPRPPVGLREYRAGVAPSAAQVERVYERHAYAELIGKMGADKRYTFGLPGDAAVPKGKATAQDFPRMTVMPQSGGKLAILTVANPTARGEDLRVLEGLCAAHNGVLPIGDPKTCQALAGYRGTPPTAETGNVRTIEVDASVLWVDTGVTLRKGQRFRIEASGKWSNVGPPALGPAGFRNYKYPGTLLAEADLGSLIGRIGDTMFGVGERYGGASPVDGRLFLSINDTPATFADNQGRLQVKITLE
jgi:hypothetical protein